MRVRFVCVLALGLAAGCSSSGGNGSNPPGPAAAPPPPPPPPTNASLTNPTVSEIFDTTSGVITGSLSRFTGIPSGVSSVQTGLGSAVRVDFDINDGSYTIRINQGGVSETSTFRPSDRSPADSTAMIDVFEITQDGLDVTLALHKPGNPETNLNFVSYGAWQRIDSGSSVDFETSFFVFGVRTPGTDMPTTGSATFSGLIDGFWTDSLGLNAIGGTAELTADFSARSVTSTFDIIGQNVVSGAIRPFDILTGTASFGSGANSFSGSLSGQTTGFSGRWSGGFFGPDADEIGGSFRVTDGAEQAVGIFIGGRGSGAGGVIITNSPTQPPGGLTLGGGP